MDDQDRTATEPRRTADAQQAPGGASSRGPDSVAAGEPQVPVMPYDDMRGEPGENTAPKAYDASNAPKPGPKPSVSDEERDGVSGTEMTPEPALGVGKGSREGAEQKAPDRPDTGSTGAGRPAGTAEKGADPDPAGGRVS